MAILRIALSQQRDFGFVLVTAFQLRSFMTAP